MEGRQDRKKTAMEKKNVKNALLERSLGTSIFLDSPESTSQLTYKVQVKIRATTLYVGRTVFDTDNDNASRHTSSITVMEIAG